ncbi:A24 family peptidase [Syntrophothermus lipocalidus]|uniref:Peptidase A24A prepilin type IV n=1 Tax=Syntrophothermus lipocalidus (strain DSM 12680 / TGB-C1) TaxID=643648 RepID=D7CPP9_SYNLT|nr:prepilin peptidase [Syntrophothermus lipocalidus]ADI02677.1 peptidase A24A prepilin type IV [Syntrophothermus lipocalidus DSM 12680]
MTWIMVGLLALAVYFDVRERRIPNWLVLTGVLTALGWHLYQGGFSGLVFSLKGLGLGLLLLMLPFAMGGMGAGDVKLLGMVGAFKGVVFVFNAFLWMALIGGLIALAVLIREQRLGEFLVRIGRGMILALTGGRAKLLLTSASIEPFSVSFPYAAAIAMGAVAALFRGWC